LRALEEFVVEGPATLIGFHRALLSAPCFVDGGTCRGVVESEQLAQRAQAFTEHARELAEKPLPHETTRLARGSDGVSPTTTRERVVAVELDGRRHEVRIHTAAPAWAELARRHKERRKGLTGEDSGAVVSPMQGTVLEVAVSDGASIEAGDLICVVEAMKMENEIVSHRDGVVAQLSVSAGAQVAHGQLICLVRSE
jgi:acetyl-CoA/propionyl-CoA carboxylase biotin carboxyl carrier protein